MYPLAQNQQQFYQPFAPYAGFFGQNLPMGYAANQMGFPFMDNTHHYRQAHHQPQQPQGFPGESSTAPQQQLFPGESSSAPPPATSGSGTPAATTPNSHVCLRSVSGFIEASFSKPNKSRSDLKLDFSNNNQNAFP
ncbi:hypothetical protein YC2023_053381 [Brassica napus]